MAKFQAEKPSSLVYTQPVVFVPMTIDDSEVVSELEQLCFADEGWPAEAYLYELCSVPGSAYWIVRPVDVNSDSGLPAILANGGYHLIENRVHITTIATHPDWRQRRIGSWLLLNMLANAHASGASQVTLEVRVSNVAALKMYSKYGFKTIGLVENSYPDGEAAFKLMLTDLDNGVIWHKLQQMLNSIRIDLS
jgi:ribosomal-protein-alanine N-acetyltransferase